MTTRFFVGLDLGQAQDFTALAVLERPRVWYTDPPERQRPTYAVRHLERFPLGTPYAAVTQRLVQLLRTPPLPGALLAVDQTGVGQAVVDLVADGLRDHVTCTFWPVTITAGHGLTAGERGGLLVPRKDLVGILQILLQTRRLRVARSLLHAPVLVQELENFKAKPAAMRNDAIELWREGEHDDLVLAVALAAWLGEWALPVELEPPEDAYPLTVLVPV